MLISIVYFFSVNHEMQPGFVSMHFSLWYTLNLMCSYTERPLMICGLLPHSATGWISQLGPCSAACVIDLFSSKTAAVWNIWVVLQNSLKWIRFHLSKMRSPRLGQLDHFDIMDRTWPLPTCQMYSGKGAGVKTEPWAPRADMGQQMRSQTTDANAGNVSVQ